MIYKYNLLFINSWVYLIGHINLYKYISMVITVVAGCVVTAVVSAGLAGVVPLVVVSGTVSASE